MAVLCDTNVLLRSAQRFHPHYSIATGAMERLIHTNRRPVIFLQNLCGVLERSYPACGKQWARLSTERVREELERLTETLEVLSEHPRTAPLWQALVVEKRWHGGDQYLRWVAGGLLRAEFRWNRIHGYRELPILIKEHELAIVKDMPLRHATVA